VPTRGDGKEYSCYTFCVNPPPPLPAGEVPESSRAEGVFRSTPVPRSDRLITLFHRRWSAPVLAELSRDHGSRFVTLVHRLDASPGAVRGALDDLIGLGWVAPNPGYGHPLRPEYVLTARGTRLGGLCVELERELDRLDAADLAQRKWSMPTLWALRAGPSRFAQIGRRLRVVTDRALAMALRDLNTAGLVAREILDARPPTPLYAPTRPARRLLPALDGLAR